MGGAITRGDPTLTPRQLEVLEVMARGLTNREIGEVLGISSGTVRVHVAAILEALGVSNRTEATDQFHRLGLGSAGSRPSPDAQTIRPAVAVLPLATFSEEAEHFADGISEDLTTRLSRWNWFPVAARNSSFAFRNASGDVASISRTLGVRYVVDGSVRPSGDSVRVTIQLVDGHTGHNVWAQHYNRDLGARFEVQDEIVDRIVATLMPSLARAGGIQIIEGDGKAEDAWDRVQEAFARMAENDVAGWERAEALAEEALALDDRLAPAYSALLYCNLNLYLVNRTPDDPSRIDRLDALSLELETIDPAEPLALIGRAMALLARNEKAAALEYAERAHKLAPKMLYTIWLRGMLLTGLGRLEEAVEAHRQALQLAPEDPFLPMVRSTLGMALLISGNLDEALEQVTAALDQAPRMALAHSLHGGVQELQGNREGALRAYAKVREFAPDYDGVVATDRFVPDWAADGMKSRIEELNRELDARVRASATK